MAAGAVAAVGRTVWFCGILSPGGSPRARGHRKRGARDVPKTIINGGGGGKARFLIAGSSGPWSTCGQFLFRTIHWNDPASFSRPRPTGGCFLAPVGCLHSAAGTEDEARMGRPRSFEGLLPAAGKKVARRAGRMRADRTMKSISPSPAPAAGHWARRFFVSRGAHLGRDGHKLGTQRRDPRDRAGRRWRVRVRSASDAIRRRPPDRHPPRGRRAGLRNPKALRRPFRRRIDVWITTTPAAGASKAAPCSI